MSAVVVRSARAEDQPALAALWAAAFTPPLAPDQWLVDDERLSHTLVAEDDEGVWQVAVTRTMAPNHAAITALELQLTELAEAHRGFADGWGCPPAADTEH